METPAIDKLFLELSQFTRAKTQRERQLEARVDNLRTLIQGVIQRCEPSGYVGQDGQYLKELCEEFRPENACGLPCRNS